MKVHKALWLNDGSRISVQASETHYCSPRDDDGPYTKVECGFLADKGGEAITPPDEWKDYADGEFPNDVYGYVPVTLVMDYIADHGGIDIGRLL